MAKTSVLSRPMPRASLPRNSFDRGFISNFVQSGGFLNPVFAQFVPAASHGRINRSEFVRMSQVNTAAFPTIDHHIDFFKIPIRLLFSRYGDFKLAIQDTNSSALTDGASTPGFNVPTSLPYLTTENIGTYVISGNPQDQLGFPYSYNSRILLDSLGYNADNCLNYSSSAYQGYKQNLNALKLLAYQKVYYDHFRNTAYESNNPFAYNADWAYVNGNNGNLSTLHLDEILKPRYANYRKDYFTNIYPSLNYVVSSPVQGSWLIPNSVVGVFPGNSFNPNNQPILNDVISSAQLSPSVLSGRNSAGNSYISVSVQQIRSIFALDKLMRASAYAPKHVKQQMEARFGIIVPDIIGNESEKLGSFMSDIVIGEVTSTANTGSTGDPLGAIGGKGVGAQSHGDTISFDTGADDCIIMGISYFMIRSFYDSTRVDNFNMKFTKEDIFVPEFENLGLQPIYQMERKQNPANDAAAIAYNNKILGYVPRYQEYKLGIDENHSYFNAGKPLQSFVNHTSLKGNNNAGNGVSLGYFKVDPRDFDTIFVDAYDPLQNSEHFFGQIRFKFDCRQNMDVHGQPRL